MTARISPDQNQLQPVRLEDIEPSSENVRLFVAQKGLGNLQEIYANYAAGKDPVLPDPPVLRWRGKGQKLEILSGHRRVTAAGLAGVTALPCRVLKLDDEQAYHFIVSANESEGITTVEVAYRAYQMSLLGFENHEIVERLGANGVSLNRYLQVGALVDPDAFTDNSKQCDPGITLWHDAAVRGPEHFEQCFRAWDAGLWDEKMCERLFRQADSALPLDNKAKGIRVSVSKDGRQMKVIGTLDLDMLTEAELLGISSRAVAHMLSLVHRAAENPVRGFGPRVVANYNPETLPGQEGRPESRPARPAPEPAEPTLLPLGIPDAA
jgi:hypothetical protein